MKRGFAGMQKAKPISGNINYCEYIKKGHGVRGRRSGLGLGSLGKPGLSGPWGLGTLIMAKTLVTI